MSRGVNSPIAASRALIDIDAVRREHPIAELIESYGIELRRVGTSLVGRCPFHQDGGRPNLHVYRSGRWICYRCDQRGDVIGFVQQIENLSFREAAGRLNRDPSPSQRAKRRRASSTTPSPRRPRIGVSRHPDEYGVLAAATDLYANQLRNQPHALDYMAGRGFPHDLLDRYRIGFAVEGELIRYLRWRRLSIGAAIRVGLITSDGHEFLAGRLIIPELRQAQPIWMIGRIVGTTDGPVDSSPVYLGLPGYKPLLGWDQAILDTRGVCLVEGPMDLLALRMWGVPGLALTGNAIHCDNLSLLDKFHRLYLALDQDAGGRQGTDCLLSHFGSRAIRVGLPEGVKDVAELAQVPDGDQSFRTAILSAIAAAQLTDDAAAAARRPGAKGEPVG